MAIGTKLMTAEDLSLFPRDLRCELVAGQVIPMTPAGPQHGQVAATVARLIGNFIAEHRLGRVYGAETGFLLERNPDHVRAPAAAFIRRDRVLDIEQGFYPGAPDLAAEVASPGDSEDELHGKARMWLGHGTLACWVIWPRDEEVDVFTAGAKTHRRLQAEDELTGEPVLPGFRCAVADLFA